MENEAVTVKKEKRDDDGTLTLSTGVRVRIIPVPQSVIQDALTLVKQPEVPQWYNKEMERYEDNPLHPDYLAAQELYQREMMRVTFDVFALFGVELIDGVPDGDWLKKLQLAAKMGRLDLSRFDLDDEVDREFVYKRFVAMSNQDYTRVGLLSGITPEEVDRAVDSFQRDEARGEDH